MVGDDCEEGEGLVQLAKPQPAAEATLLSNFPHEAVQACCEGSLKQLSCEASPSLFKSGKAAALFAGRVRWKLLRLKKSRVSQFIQNTVVPAWVGESWLLHSRQKNTSRLTCNMDGGSLLEKWTPTNKVIPGYQETPLTICP